MKALLVEPGMKPRMIEIENTLHAFQEAVDGYIQVMETNYENTVIICNEEGKIKGLQMNRILITEFGMYDVIVGNMVVVGVDGEEFCDINPMAATYFSEKLSGLICEI